jgi:hypothetical protein
MKKVCEKRNIFNSSLFLDLSTESETLISTEEPDIELMKESSVQQSRKRAPLSLFNHHQQHKSSKTGANNQNNPPVTTSLVSESSSSTTAPYVYIDHQKTTTLKEIANERLQQQARRIEI